MRAEPKVKKGDEVDLLTGGCGDHARPSTQKTLRGEKAKLL